MEKQLETTLKEEGYWELKEFEEKGICGLMNFIFTVGLVVNIDEHSYSGRYCFERRADAIESFRNWDGKNDPPGNWIKYKGEGGERRNSKYIQQKKYDATKEETLQSYKWFTDKYFANKR